MQKVADHFKKKFSEHLEDLKTLVRIPSVSFVPFPPAEVKRCAEAVAKLLKKTGLENVQILEVAGAHPYVYGESLKAPGKPTLLLYAHHDVQPPGREELWQTPSFEPVLKPGPGGDRLYGRGTADDKAGIIVHTAAVSSYLETLGKLPVNVKVIIEGEEEIGSGHLLQFLTQYRKLLDADILVLTDTGNLASGVPALTVALRGMVGIGVEVRALTKSLHSGMWGGPIPDPVLGLTKALSQLVDASGRIAIPGVLDQVRPLTSEEEVELKKLPFDETEFRKESGMLSHSELLKEGSTVFGQLWRLSSLTVNAIEASSRKQAGNIINDLAWAKVTIRLVPDMDPKKVMGQLQEFIRSKVPWGLQVSFTEEACAGPWSTEPVGPAFEAAVAAMKKGYGVAPYMIGCGGSIPFVEPFAKALKGAPALLIGVEDPHTNAHGENESVLVSDLYKSCLSQIYLFSEIAARF